MKDNTASVHAQVPVDVATFLLNEKRVDLQLLEARHRVNVLLIPNIHIETPNYTVTRLRHDDLNQGEPLAPSYEMVAMPSEEEKAEGAAEPATPRPEAAVKGITLMQQAAPVSAPAPAPAAPTAAALPSATDDGIIGKIMGWFRRKPSSETAAPAAAEPARNARPARGANGNGRPQRGERGAGRGERSERGGERQERGGRGGRGERGERGPRREREGSERNGEDRQRRGRERGPREDRPQEAREQQRAPVAAETVELDQTNLVNAAPQTQGPEQQGGEERSGGRRRRGRRGGADRAAGEPGQERQGQQQKSDRVWYPRTPFVPNPESLNVIPNASDSVPAEELVHESMQTAAPLTTPASVQFAEPAPAPVSAPVVHEEPVLAQPEPVVAEPVAVQQQPAAVAVAAPVVAPAPAPAPVAPQPLKIEWPSDLQQVETNAARVQAVQSVVDDGAPKRIKRVRPPVEVTANEPLQQVETRN